MTSLPLPPPPAGTRVCDVLVAGGGIVGATLALALARGGLAVTVVDAEAADAPPDPRASAVAAAAFRAWETLGLGADALAEAQPIRRLAVGDGPGASAGSPAWALAAALRFDAEELGPDAGPIAFMVPNAPLRRALKAAAVDAGARWMAGARVAGVEADVRRAMVRLADGAVLEAPLAVGAEGRRSAVRDAAGIGASGWSYRQEGVVATVALRRPHHGTARQLFLPEGPLAVLPLTGDRASLVWSTSPSQARALVESPAAAFEAVLARTLGDEVAPGGLLGARARFPLELRLAERMTAPRIALAGDAAQVIHPVAGQGLNLGLKDAAALAETVIEARRLGEDWGAAVTLERYARWRRFDRLALAAGADAFVRLFSTASPLARAVRGAAFLGAGASAPLRRAFMREAGGVAGEPPRLFLGRPI